MHRLVKNGIKGVSDTCFLTYSEESEGYYLPYKDGDAIEPQVDVMCESDMHNFLWDTYCKDGFEPKDTDTIIDVGAFVGGFSVAAFKNGCRKIYALEPDPKNFECLKKNIYNYEAQKIISPIQLGLYSDATAVTQEPPVGGMYPTFDYSNTDGGINFTTLNEFITSRNLFSDNLYIKVSVSNVKYVLPRIMKGLQKLKPRVFVFDLNNKQHPKTRKLLTNQLSADYDIEYTKSCLYAKSKSVLNKTIWQLFFQGKSSPEFPDVDKLSSKLWHKRNSGSWVVNFLDEKTLGNYIPEYYDIVEKAPERTLQAKSDLVRLLLLSKCGGVWVDTSVYPTIELDKIYHKLVNETGFFAYRFTPRRIKESGAGVEVASWFLVVDRPHHYLIDKWLEAFTERFISDKGWEYFTIHDTLCTLYDSDDKIKDVIDNMHQISEHIPHSACLTEKGKKWESKLPSYMYKRPRI